MTKSEARKQAESLTSVVQDDKHFVDCINNGVTTLSYSEAIAVALERLIETNRIAMLTTARKRGGR